MQILTRIKNQFFADHDHWILWLPVFFGCGIIFYFSFPNNFYFLPLALFFSAIFLIIIFRNQLWKLPLIALAVFIIGFLWTKFYTEQIAFTNKVEHKFYATAIGRVDDVNSFYNPILKRNAYQIILRDVALYKAGSIVDDVVIRKEKPKKVRKYKKKNKKKKCPNNQESNTPPTPLIRGEKKDLPLIRGEKKDLPLIRGKKKDLPLDRGEMTEGSEPLPSNKRGLGCVLVGKEKKAKRKYKKRKKKNQEEIVEQNDVSEFPHQDNALPLGNDVSNLNSEQATTSLQEANGDVVIQNVDQEKPKKKRRKRKKNIEEEIINSENSESILQPENETLPISDDVSNLNSEQPTPSLRGSEADAAIQNVDEEEKPKKKRKRKKKSAYPESTSRVDLQQNKIKKPKPKKSKRDNKTVIKSYLNVAGYQEIDREFLAVDYKSQNQNWVENRYIKAPKKIILSVNTKMNDVKIGDIIQTRVVLEPFKPPYFPGGYDKGFENYFKGIGGGGYAASDLKLLKARNENSFFQDIKILRQNIAKKILDQMDEQGGTMAVALLVGSQNLIKPNVMQAMRNSGLAHLISISGLHFTLAAGIFFFSIRFLLSLNQYLTLNYDIKKIAAAIAIATGFFYLLLADMPVPAVRSFIVVALIFSAILLDLKPDAFRSTAFAALAILIFSPNVIFSVSFQLSFAAILALIVLADLSKPIHLNSSNRPLYLKFFFYFLGIILSSLAATIATTPFSIYHFNNFISFGALANLAAIPIASFITMPCGFLALLLMPFGIEKIALYPMQISIHWIIDIASYVAAMPNSYLTIKAISPLAFGLIIFGGLWLILWQKSWRLLGLLPIILGIYLGIKTPIPNLLIDGNKKLLAFYSNQTLIFIKPTKSKQALVWAKKLGLNEFRNIDDLSEEEKQNLQLNCDKNFCQFQLQEKRILVLKGRNQIEEICQEQYEKNYYIVVNLSKKYKLPQCFLNSEMLIDSKDLKNGVLLIY